MSMVVLENDSINLFFFASTFFLVITQVLINVDFNKWKDRIGNSCSLEMDEML